MTTTRVFRSGNSQAVRIPLEFQLACDEVEIERVGSDLILRPASSNRVERLIASLALFEHFPDREQPAQPDAREDL
ncbi:MAG: AbrB/MazE/SpoVT family DNA-binding domain-containing protein [Aquabacterium sp.]|uniref:antitoxin n=1 Tax=Aquabacterium sp. TaxID=1872578 RepID=UPI0027261CC3|nr:AbrB/MazE/SpoVT family DNA-binding domain-containing protein [Aquabacterium sp.]MDO9002187.1 AbrB/MazE/SpoVT family DNA-binding domain-containing protein [Aquabacterium sp.]